MWFKVSWVDIRVRYSGYRKGGSGFYLKVFGVFEERASIWVGVDEWVWFLWVEVDG